MLTGERAAPRRRIPSRTGKIVNRCLKESPSRWQSAAELQRELAEAHGARRGRKIASDSSVLRVPKEARKAKIVLGEFENKTGDPVFDEFFERACPCNWNSPPS